MGEVDQGAVRYWRRHWRTQRWARRAARDDEEPWALPIVVRTEKSGPVADGQHAMYAAALAVVRLLAHPAGLPEGPWHDPLERWMDGRIRKVVRRARGSRWAEVADLPGVTAAVVDTQVRALLPHLVSAAPPAVGRLQVQGLELDSDPVRELAGFPDEALPAPTLSIVVAPRVEMSTGKACAQVGHAAQLGLLQLNQTQVLAWLGAGCPLRIVAATPEQWARLPRGDREVAMVHDAGYTEVEPGTRTCAATFADLTVPTGKDRRRPQR